MKSIIFAGLFVILLTVSLHAADSTKTPASADEIVIVEKNGGAEFDIFIDKDGDGICDNRTLRNKGIFSRHQKIHHYRMISYKYDYQFRCEFGSSSGLKKGESGNGQHGGNPGHHGGQ
ncbi:MAG: hypothetical protein RAP70_06880 [Candidatus Celaenobacter antarcticus]|nr:hypothetical protein [Candidatus Celaenobacter antarcticus]